jgi:integrase
MYYSKSFYFAYYLSGKKYEKSAGPDKKAAQEAEWKMKLSVAEGKAYTPISWKSSVEELERTYPKLSPKTVEMYRNCVANLSMQFSSMKLSDITERHLEIFKSAHLQKGVSASSFNQHRATLKRIFALSGRDWRFKKSIFTSEKETARDRFLSEDEKGRLVEACKKTPYLHMAILVALDTGLRKNSVITLIWDDIDFKENVVTKIGKGGKVHRIPLTSRLKAHLLRYRMKQGGASQFIFCNPSDPSKAMADIRKSFKTACVEAGVPDLRFHDLRRTLGSHLAMVTKDLVLVQEMLGHSDISTTRKHYAHLTDDHKKAGIKLFEEATS